MIRRLPGLTLLSVLFIRLIALELQVWRYASEVKSPPVSHVGEYPSASSSRAEKVSRSPHDDNAHSGRMVSADTMSLAMVTMKTESSGVGGLHNMPPWILQLMQECNSTRRLVVEPKGFDEDVPTRTRRWVENAEFFTDCPCEARSFDLEHISPIVHRIWECDEIPSDFTIAVESWVNNTSGKFFVLWTRETRRRYIERTLGKVRLELYLRLVPGAFRADLFRYIVLYHLGGVYSDVDTTLHLNPEGVTRFSKGVTVAIDINKSRLLNGAILITPPNHPLFFCAIGEVFHHSERRTHFKSDLDVSGPGVLGECLRHIVGRDDEEFSQEFVEELDASEFHLLHSEVLSGEHFVRLHDGTTFVSVVHGGKPYDRNVSEECDPGEHYSVLHKKGTVYREEG